MAPPSHRDLREALRRRLRQLPILGPAVAWVGRRVLRPRFPGSARFWEQRYARGGTSGAGSYGALAAFKADVLNRFVAEHGIRTVLELGCGDGHQLSLAAYPSYLGFDVSPSAVALCARRFGGDPSKRFLLLRDYAGQTAELALSLDVLFHLVEDEVFERHLRTLFGAAERFVIVYSSDFDARSSPHVRHRAFTAWIGAHLPEWERVRRIPNAHPYRPDEDTGSLAEFHVFARRAAD